MVSGNIFGFDTDFFFSNKLQQILIARVEKIITHSPYEIWAGRHGTDERWLIWSVGASFYNNLLNLAFPKPLLHSQLFIWKPKADPFSWELWLSILIFVLWLLYSLSAYVSFIWILGTACSSVNKYSKNLLMIVSLVISSTSVVFKLNS